MHLVSAFSEVLTTTNSRRTKQELLMFSTSGKWISVASGWPPSHGGTKNLGVRDHGSQTLSIGLIGTRVHHPATEQPANCGWNKKLNSDREHQSWALIGGTLEVLIDSLHVFKPDTRRGTHRCNWVFRA